MTNKIKSIKVSPKFHLYLKSLKIKYQQETMQDLFIFLIRERKRLRDELEALKNKENDNESSNNL